MPTPNQLLILKYPSEGVLDSEDCPLKGPYLSQSGPYSTGTHWSE